MEAGCADNITVSCLWNGSVVGAMYAWASHNRHMASLYRPLQHVVAQLSGRFSGKAAHLMAFLSSSSRFMLMRLAPPAYLVCRMWLWLT